MQNTAMVIEQNFRGRLFTSFSEITSSSQSVVHKKISKRNKAVD